jgi:hypothetical protein
MTVRFRFDGTDPTPSVGMPLAPGSLLHLRGDLSLLRFVAQGAGAVLNVLYFGDA